MQVQGSLSPLKYLLAYIIPVLVWVSFVWKGWSVYLPVIFAFAFIPLIELIFPPDHRNADDETLAKVKNNPLFDIMLYLAVPVQVATLCWFVWEMYIFEGPLWERAGMITGMGLMCGVIGINIAHELGHRIKLWERRLAKVLLFTSLYVQFYFDHNKGHHRYVGTPQDPSSAKYNEPLYFFWIRSLTGTFRSAWHIESERMIKLGLPVLHWRHEMLRSTLLYIFLLTLIAILLTPMVAICFAISALMGGLLLETVNYIEHYGLTREKKGKVYERVRPWHSWNSDHVVGRLVLFELSRHSDHHYLASKKYQTLDYHASAPQMPTGYPGMMVLATIPPLWFYIMNRRLKKEKQRLAEAEQKVAA